MIQACGRRLATVPIGVLYDKAERLATEKSGTEGDEMHFALWVFPS